MNNNENDWKKIDEWNEKRKQDEKEKFGVNFAEIDSKRRHKGVNKIVKGMKIAGKTIKFGGIITIIIVIAIVVLILGLIISNINARTNVKAEKTIEEMYNTKIDLVSKEVDDKENGKYFFKVSNNSEIQFIAIKKYGNLSEDYLDNCHKYYFEKWQSKEKEIFIVNQNKIGDVLDYDTYIIINTYEELEDAMKNINNFVDFCGENFSTAWRIYIKKGNYMIYPYQSRGMTKEEATEKAEELYKNISFTNDIRK